MGNCRFSVSLWYLQERDAEEPVNVHEELRLLVEEDEQVDVGAVVQGQVGHGLVAGLLGLAEGVGQARGHVFSHALSGKKKFEILFAGRTFLYGES